MRRPSQVHVGGERPLAEGDVALEGVVHAEGVADPPGGGQPFGRAPAGHQRFDSGFLLVGQLETVAGEQLDSVVLERVVRGRDDAAGVRLLLDGEHGDARRGQRPQEEDVGAHGAQARHQSALQHGAAQSGVLADHHPGTRAALALFEHVRRGPAEAHGRLHRHRLAVGDPAHAVRTEQLLLAHLQLPVWPRVGEPALISTRRRMVERELWPTSPACATFELSVCWRRPLASLRIAKGETGGRPVPGQCRQNSLPSGSCITTQ